MLVIFLGMLLDGRILEFIFLAAVDKESRHLGVSRNSGILSTK